jgi:hypothetical protein
MEKFGDWRNPATTSVILDTKQEPKIYWVANIDKNVRPISESGVLPVNNRHSSSIAVLAESKAAALLLARYNQLSNPTAEDFEFLKIGLALIEAKILIDQNEISNIPQHVYEAITKRSFQPLDYAVVKSMNKLDRTAYLTDLIGITTQWWDQKANVNLKAKMNFSDNTYFYPVIIGNLKKTKDISLEEIRSANKEQLGDYAFRGQFGLIYTSNIDNLQLLPAAPSTQLLTKNFNGAAEFDLSLDTAKDLHLTALKTIVGNPLSYNQVYHRIAKEHPYFKSALDQLLQNDPRFSEFIKKSKLAASIFYKDFIKLTKGFYTISEENTKEIIKYKLNLAKRITKAVADPETFFQIRHSLLIQDELIEKYSRMSPVYLKSKDANFILDRRTN